VAVADGAAGDEIHRLVVAETPVAGRCVELAAVAVEHLEADGVQRPHHAAGGLVIAAHGFQATAIGQAGEFLARVRLDARQEQRARRQIPARPPPTRVPARQNDSNGKPHGDAVFMIQGRRRAGNSLAACLSHGFRITGQPDR
jgi:hypothetical protein